MYYNVFYSILSYVRDFLYLILDSIQLHVISQYFNYHQLISIFYKYFFQYCLL